MPQVGSQSLFKITDFQSRGADQIINRYWYIQNAPIGSVPASTIADNFETIFSVWLPPVQSTAVTHDTIEVDEVTAIGNFIERVSAIPDGTLVGTTLPNFVAAKIRLLRTTKETRSGWKRIGIATEESVIGNFWEAAYQAALDSLAAVMNDTLNNAAGSAFPCIVRQTKDPITGAPLAPALWIYNLISAAEAQVEVTTQNTRKVGRGA